MRTSLLSLAVMLAACGSSDKPGPGDSPDAPSDPTIDAGPTQKLCGGLGALTCGADEYCNYEDNSCGAASGTADETGSCVKRPAACPALLGRPVCGCDARVHISECATYADGTDLRAAGGCPKEPGTFECGYLLCSLANDYCRREPHATGPETFSCVTRPVCQGIPSCACLAGERCGTACAGDDRTGLTLTCPATPG